jgi:hypothetical protein
LKALAQLLEYRLDYGHPDDLVVVVVDAEVGSRRTEILERLGLAALPATSDQRRADEGRPSEHRSRAHRWIRHL